MSEFDVSYLSTDSISEGVGVSQILTLLEQLSRLNLKLSLVTFEKSVPSTWIEDRIKIAGIDWRPLPFAKSGVLAGAKRLTRLARKIPDTKVIHGRSDIPTLAALISRKAPVLWDVRSLWGEQRAILNPSQFNPLVSSVVHKIEEINAHKALGMSSLTSAVVPYLLAKHQVLPKIQRVIPTCVDLEKFSQQTMPKGDLKLLLSGSFNSFYDIELTRQIITKMRQRGKLEVVWARDLAAANQKLNVGEDSIVSLKHSEMPTAVSSVHFGLVACKMNAGPSLLAAMPTKVAEFWATGRPVLVSHGIGDLDGMIQEFNVGVIIHDTSNIDQIYDQLLSLLEDPDTPNRCREVAEKYFDIKSAATKYKNLYSLMQ